MASIEEERKKMSDAQRKLFDSLTKNKYNTPTSAPTSAPTTTNPSAPTYGSGRGSSSKKSSEVAIRDYINSYGSQYGIKNSDIGWDNGQVTLGGSPLLTPSRIGADNRSYANEADIKNAIDAYAAGKGYIPQGYNVVTSPGYGGYKSPYSDQINAMLKKLNSAPAFNPDSIYSSPEYLAMKQKLESQGQETSKNVMADFASMTGGMPSSYAIAAAKESSENIQNQLNQALPSLLQAAYNRHLQEQGMTMDQINMLANMDNSGYQRFADERNYYQDVLESNRAYNQANKQFDYNAKRDQLLDQRWLDQFDYQKKQDALNYGLQSRQVSVSERNAQLARDQAAWAKDPTNPANMKNPETIGALYSSMFASGDPEKWIKQNAQYLSDDELKALVGYLPSNSAAAILGQVLGQHSNPGK